VKIGSKLGKRRMIRESGKSEIFAAWAFAGADGNQYEQNPANRRQYGKSRAKITIA